MTAVPASEADPVGGPDLEPRGYPGLNALRALGALMVMTTHSAYDTGRIVDGWTGAVLARMDFGVALFFVLSGFLLSRPFLLRAALGRPAPGVRHYLWKRALRILPLYWLVVAAAWLLEPTNRGTVSSADWVRNLTLTQLYHVGLLPTGLTQMWSLATEAAFYLVLPALCVLLLGLRRRFSLRRVMVVLAVVTGAGIAWQAHFASRPGAAGHEAQWLPGYLPWFACGIALAAVTVHQQVTGHRSRLTGLADDPVGCWLLAAALYGLACTPIAGPRVLLIPTSSEAVVKLVLYAAAATLFVMPLVLGRIGAGRLRRACSHRVPFFLGEISFGIFCIHVLVMKAVFRISDTPIFTGHFPLVLGCTAAVTIALATAAHYVVERPFLRLKNAGRFGATASTTRETAAATSS